MREKKKWTMVYRARFQSFFGKIQFLPHYHQPSISSSKGRGWEKCADKMILPWHSYVQISSCYVS